MINKASELARVHRMQLWDGVVCAASAQAGARVLLTEDMQDRRIIDGLRLMNPFAAANAKPIDDLFAGRIWTRNCRISARDGVGSPERWLCITITLGHRRCTVRDVHGK